MKKIIRNKIIMPIKMEIWENILNFNDLMNQYLTKLIYV